MKKVKQYTQQQDLWVNWNRMNQATLSSMLSTYIDNLYVIHILKKNDSSSLCRAQTALNHAQRAHTHNRHQHLQFQSLSHSSTEIDVCAPIIGLKIYMFMVSIYHIHNKIQASHTKMPLTFDIIFVALCIASFLLANIYFQLQFFITYSNWQQHTSERKKLNIFLRMWCTHYTYVAHMCIRFERRMCKILTQERHSQERGRKQ